jgi:cytochrome c oxidase assembly protein subunit 11
VLAMFGFGYLLVPIYNVLCDQLGLNGKTGGQAALVVSPVDEERTIVVQFLASRNGTLPWKFYPLIKTFKIHPGESKKIEYFAQNETNQVMTVQAIPSVTPGLAAKYLKKTECFCFAQQTLKPHESMKMPLIFHIDRDIPDNIKVLSLSYTLFDVTGKEKSNTSKAIGKIN